MTFPPITTKRQFYALMAAGQLGNCCQQWFDLDSWQRDQQQARFPRWGLRSLRGGGDSRMRLNVPTVDVAALYTSWYKPGEGNISPMIDDYAVLRAEVALLSPEQGAAGLYVHYVPLGSEIDPADPWRGSFKRHGKHATGLLAASLLRVYLWPSDYEDLMVLLDRYPGHVIEFTACDRAVGLIANRNTIFWEVRKF